MPVGLPLKRVLLFLLSRFSAFIILISFRQFPRTNDPLPLTHSPTSEHSLIFLYYDKSPAQSLSVSLSSRKSVSSGQSSLRLLLYNNYMIDLNSVRTHFLKILSHIVLVVIFLLRLFSLFVCLFV